MSDSRKIIAWILSFAIIFYGLLVPVFAAADPDPTDSRGDFYDWVINSGSLDKERPGGSFGGDRWNGGGGRFSKQQYDDYVQELPAPVYGADGSIYVIPTTFQILRSSEFLYELSNGEIKERSNGFDRGSVNLPLIRYELLQKSYDSASKYSYIVGFRYKIPFLCSAELLYSSATYSTNIESGELFLTSSGSNYFGGIRNYEAGVMFCARFQTSSFSMIKSDNYILPGNYVLFSFPDLRLKLTPYATLSDTTYNVNTRPTTITGGNYGIIGDDGTINTVTNNNQIVNETTNNYYNPATGQTSTITDWSYNYENRTYDITLDTGDKVQVEYGDQNITITENNVVEGDTIVNNYIIYYMIDGSTPACDHVWQAGESTAPTCISPGKTLNTCTKCGATSVDISPALGHDWQVLRTVLTEYDEDGNLIQEGYTLYECSRCGEQYKDSDSTGPPTPSTGTNDGGLLEFLNGIIKFLSDNLSGVVELLRRFFSEIPGLFSGFTGFLAAVFPFLPDEIILLFTFGMAALVFVGVIRAMRR